MEVYIDGVGVKSTNFSQHLANLKQSFIRIQQHSLKMNLAKYVFGVSTGNFLGFLVHSQGIEVDKNKTKAMLEARPPRNKKKLQSLIGKVNFLRRFITNSTGKMKAFLPLLRLKPAEDFIQDKEQQKAFDQIKECLANPPVLTPLTFSRPLKLYISAPDDSIDSLLAQDVEDSTEKVVYYLSQLLNDVETRYKPIEIWCLSLFNAYTKLKYYLLPREVLVMCKIDIVKYLLNRLVLQGTLMKWAIKLNAFSLKYVPLRVFKGQALADFLAEHPCVDIQDPLDNYQGFAQLESQVLAFDGSKHQKGVRTKIVITNPNGKKSKYMCSLDLQSSNNQAQYQTVIHGLKILSSMEAKVIKILGDSQLLIKQLIGEYK